MFVEIWTCQLVRKVFWSTMLINSFEKKTKQLTDNHYHHHHHRRRRHRLGILLAKPLCDDFPKQIWDGILIKIKEEIFKTFCYFQFISINRLIDVFDWLIDWSMFLIVIVQLISINRLIDVFDWLSDWCFWLIKWLMFLIDWVIDWCFWSLSFNLFRPCTWMFLF